MSAAAPSLATLPAAIDLYGAEALLALLQDLLLPGAHLNLDAAAVTRVGTPGLQLLLAARRTAAAQGSTVALVAPSSCLRDAIAELGLEAAFGFAAGGAGTGG